MDEKEITIIADALKGASKLGTVGALVYIKNGFEAFKKLEIPINNSTVERPYLHFETRKFVDFMIEYLDEAVKALDKKEKSD